MHINVENHLKNIGIAIICIIGVLSVVFCSIKLKDGANDVGLTPHKTTIVIDAGHGGIDSGVSGIKSKVKESSLNLEYSKCLLDILVSFGFNVVLTRPTEAGLYGSATKGFKKRDMLKRKKIIERSNADILVSIHMNYCNVKSRRSAQTFYKNEHDDSKKLAFAIQNEINALDETVKKTSPLVGDYYILNCAEIPSVLVECGFLSNEIDERMLLDEKYKKSLCYAVYKGIVFFLTNK